MPSQRSWQPFSRLRFALLWILGLPFLPPAMTDNA
jgi:hypothetical protein